MNDMMKGLLKMGNRPSFRSTNGQIDMDVNENT